ncbi:hypothetical protein GCM10027028_45250 [Streptomyces sundarbansensis]
MGAVRAAETGINPEKGVARSAPMRCIPLYQQTKPITVTTTACQSRADSTAGGYAHLAPGDIARGVAALVDTWRTGRARPG